MLRRGQKRGTTGAPGAARTSIPLPWWARGSWGLRSDCPPPRASAGGKEAESCADIGGIGDTLSAANTGELILQEQTSGHHNIQCALHRPSGATEDRIKVTARSHLKRVVTRSATNCRLKERTEPRRDCYGLPAPTPKEEGRETNRTGQTRKPLPFRLPVPAARGRQRMSLRSVQLSSCSGQPMVDTLGPRIF